MVHELCYREDSNLDLVGSITVGQNNYPPYTPTLQAEETQIRRNSPVMGWGGLSKKSKCQKNEPSINQN